MNAANAFTEMEAGSVNDCGDNTHPQFILLSHQAQGIRNHLIVWCCPL